MPRGVGSGFNTRLQNDLLELAILVKVTRRDAVVLGFTSADHDLVVDAVTYYSADGLDIASFHTSLGSGIDNSEVTGFLSDARLSLDDLEKGLYNGATIETYYVHRNNLGEGAYKLSKAFVGEIVDDLDTFRAEIRGLLDIAKQQIGWLTSGTCRWAFGGTECGFSKATDTNSIASVTSNRVFTAVGLGSRGDNFFRYGVITFTSGACDGLSMEVKGWTQSTKEIELQLEMPADVEAGDTFTISEGCDRLWATCKAKGNAERFGGEPHMPGLDQILRIPK